MKTSSTGRTLIENSEGKRLVAYRCPAGVWTIGYGHTTAAGLPTVTPGLRITAEEADAILASDLEKFEAEVSRDVKVPLAQHEFDALVSFTFNLGPGALRKSTLLRKLNQGDHHAVPSELLKWNRADGKVLPGLTARRHAEAALWDGMAVQLPHAGPVPKKVDTPKAYVPHKVSRTAPPVITEPPAPSTSKAPTNIIRTIFVALAALFGVTATAHAAEVAVTPFATDAINATLPLLGVVSTFCVGIVANVLRRYFDQKTSAALAENVNVALNWAISHGVKKAEQWIDREDFHVSVDGWVTGLAVDYAQKHFPKLAKQAGGDLAEKVKARLASHTDLLALKAKASA